jgi:hypothetical protein
MGLAQSIIDSTPLTPAEKDKTRVVIADDEGRILADSEGRQLVESVPNAWLDPIETNRRGFSMVSIDGKPHCIGYADSPGYETYATGWNSLVIQPIDQV